MWRTWWAVAVAAACTLSGFALRLPLGSPTIHRRCAARVWAADPPGLGELSDFESGGSGGVSGEEEAPPEAKSMEELQAEFRASASGHEVEVERQLELGLECLRAGLAARSLTAFDKALELEPSTSIWQRGIALYFLGRFDEAQEQLGRDGAAFTARWEQPATEESIWAAAALYHRCPLGSDLSECFAPLPFEESNAMLATAHDVFVGREPVDSLHDRISNQVQANAQSVNLRMRDPMGRLTLGHFYLGLWFDAAEGDVAKACEQMAVAADLGDPSSLVTSLAQHFPKLVQERGPAGRNEPCPVAPATGSTAARAPPPPKRVRDVRGLLSSVDVAAATPDEEQQQDATPPPSKAAAAPATPAAAPTRRPRPLVDVVADIKAQLEVAGETTAEAVAAAEAQVGLASEGTIKDRTWKLAFELGVETDAD